MLGGNKKDGIALPENYLPMETPKLRLKMYLSDAPFNSSNPQSSIGDEPIADFWPNTTILFSSLSGFSAWSSTREPSQVFTLLETVYGAMDKAAGRLGVFKVETVGDCYVAVSKFLYVLDERLRHGLISVFLCFYLQATGLPEPRDDVSKNS
jgi:hypothetical protein